VVGDDCAPHSDHKVRELLLGPFQGPVACMHITFDETDRMYLEEICKMINHFFFSASGM
jgi:putative methionine-R-sulfoxide reductase with GAF domain